MPRGTRRPPPSSLLLVPIGPMLKGKPKHVLPSVPAPTFQPQFSKSTAQRMTHKRLPPLVSDAAIFQPTATPEQDSCGIYSSESERSWWSYGHGTSNSLSSLDSTLSDCSSSPTSVSFRGPWDYSAPFRIDMTCILSRPKPVAIGAIGP